LPNDEDVKLLAGATWDLSEYVMDIAKNEGIAPGMKVVGGGITIHVACHARAQNMGQKAAEMARLVPEADVTVVERCSGHGGAWGYKKEHYDVALKVGKPVARSVNTAGATYVASECPLAGLHIIQGIEQIPGATPPQLLGHPIEFLARAYGVVE